MDREKILEYYNSCNPYCIELVTKFKLENGESNPDYFRNVILEMEKAYDNDLIEQNFDFETTKRLKGEIRLISILYSRLIQFFEGVCLYVDALRNKETDKSRGYITRINLNLIETKKIFTQLEYQKLFISEFIKSEDKTAINVRDFCKYITERLLLHFKDFLNTDLLNSPFEGLFVNHLKVLKESISPEEYSFLKNTKSKSKPNNLKVNEKNENPKYSLKSIKAAYFCLKEDITENNYLEILNDYSKSRSNKILQKPIYKTSQLTSITENKTADTKHLNALKDAKRLLNGIKDKEALNSIDQIISTFEANYKKQYK